METTTNTKLAAFCNYHLWEVQELLIFVIAFVCLYQGGRGCTGARVAPAEKFGLGQKF